MSNLIDKVIFGGLYKVPAGQWNNGQSNRLCVPVVDEKGKLWMQDTYQIQRPSLKEGEDNVTDAQINRMILYGDGEHSWCLKHARDNYYYKNQAMITSKNELARYELIADLRDYRNVKSGEDYRDYKDEDVLHGVKLFFEHGYSWTYGNIGVHMIRKDAVKNNVSLLKKHTNDLFGAMARPDSFAYQEDNVSSALERVEDTEENHDVILKARYAIMLSEKLRQMRTEFERYDEGIRAELGLE